ncbi:steroid receptor RNA activator 1-like [Anopheles stephensi]|uniref:steroid receptor RNA activator 1-like n=1 Tax=Anopheles stephensi TaxID=30069 RepID=UPI0007D2A233|nr:steroid receptor RNA activator 1-like [Anopheles stephensi]
MSGENYRSATKSHEPGWNDPPPKLVGKKPAPTTDATDSLPDREEMFRQTQTVFDDYVQSVEEARRPTVQKRFQLMYQQWTDKKLPEVLEQLIYKLAIALSKQDVKRANAVHRTIVCDYGSICVMWAPVLRHPIVELQQRTEDAANDENSILQPI